MNLLAKMKSLVEMKSLAKMKSAVKMPLVSQLVFTLKRRDCEASVAIPLAGAKHLVGGRPFEKVYETLLYCYIL